MSTLRERIREAPYRFNLLAVMRAFERGAPDNPRIGSNTTLEEEVLKVGQDPFLGFAPSNISAFEEPEKGVPGIRARFLGFFGPHGALPLHTTEETLEWSEKGNKSFVRFADIFATRFYQLFYRVWSAARPATQFDRPDADRFQNYVASSSGVPHGEDIGDTLHRLDRLHVSGLLSGRVRSAQKLSQALEVRLRTEIEVEEHIPFSTAFEPQDRAALGLQASQLGVNMHLGSRVQGVSDKVRVHVRTNSREQYEDFLPGGVRFAVLRDLAQGYLGPTIEIEVSPSLPRREITGVTLGSGGKLGRTGWLAPDTKSDPDEQVAQAVFSASSNNSPGQGLATKAA